MIWFDFDLFTFACISVLTCIHFVLCHRVDLASLRLNAFHFKETTVFSWSTFPLFLYSKSMLNLSGITFYQNVNDRMFNVLSTQRYCSFCYLCGVGLIPLQTLFLSGEFLGGEGDFNSSDTQNTSRNLGTLHQNCKG